MTKRHAVPFATAPLLLVTALQFFGLWTANSLMQQLLDRVEYETRARWESVADVAALSFQRMEPQEDRDVVVQRMEDFRRDFELSALDMTTRSGLHFRVALRQQPREIVELSRPTLTGRITAAFDVRSLNRLRATVLLLASINTATIAIAAVLLLTYLVYAARMTYLASGQLRGGAVIGSEETGIPMLRTFGDVLLSFRQRETQLQLGHDVEKRRAEDLDRVSRTLTRSLTSGFISIDRDGLLVDMNAAARDILKVGAGTEVRGHRLAEIVGPTEFASRIEEALSNRLNLNRTEVVEHSGDQPNFILGLTTAALLSDDNTFFGMIVLFTDLTPVRLLEARVREMQNLAELGQITAGIAHEFRNSLSTILGYIRLVRRTGLLNEDGDAKLERAEIEGRQLTEAVERMLTFGRPQALQKRRFDLTELTRSVAERLVSSRSEVVELVLTSGPVDCDADPILMGVVIENLIRNAIEAIEQKGGKGRVEITCKATPRPTLTIADTGVGVDPADAQRFFLPFQSGKPNGFGVGLALARKIVLLHAGSIRLTGTPGVGASVTVELPPAT